MIAAVHLPSPAFAGLFVFCLLQFRSSGNGKILPFADSQTRGNQSNIAPLRWALCAPLSNNNKSASS
jgi:hypothetical protein